MDHQFPMFSRISATVPVLKPAYYTQRAKRDHSTTFSIYTPLKTNTRKKEVRVQFFCTHRSCNFDESRSHIPLHITPIPDIRFDDDIPHTLNNHHHHCTVRFSCFKSQPSRDGAAFCYSLLARSISPTTFFPPLLSVYFLLGFSVPYPM
jgi:hypothetical protein